MTENNQETLNSYQVLKDSREGKMTCTFKKPHRVLNHHDLFVI